MLPPVGDDAYLQIPPGWEWTRLGNTGRIFNGDSVSESGKAELAKIEDGLPFIATKDVGYGRDALVYDIAEQRRIVAKVDQIMVLVDQLETQLTTSRAAAERLMEALVSELVGNGKRCEREQAVERKITQGSKGVAA